VTDRSIGRKGEFVVVGVAVLCLDSVQEYDDEWRVYGGWMVDGGRPDGG